ncbi:hypothetical protein [Botryobacter ruber]|uniref:hypothetical protein n=1 Tax=Botryobacter ruber TaxID=2171629 RepID=UPI000FEC7E7F|nr:hypothetical protein [Botryobacter ruber]
MAFRFYSTLQGKKRALATGLENIFDKLSNKMKGEAEEAQGRDSGAVGESTGTGSGRLVLLETSFVEIVLDKRHVLLCVRWLRQVTSSEYRHGTRETGRFLLDLGLELLLVNNQRMGVLTIEDQGWLARISIEVISRSRLQRLAIVSSTDMLQQLTNEVLDSRVKEETPHFYTQYFLSEQSALEWLMQP